MLNPEVFRPGSQPSRKEKALFGEVGSSHILDVPFLEPPTILEGGSTSLAMVLQYLGRKHNLPGYAEYTPQLIMGKVNEAGRSGFPTFSHLAAIAQDLTQPDGFQVELWDSTDHDGNEGRYTTLLRKKAKPPSYAAFVALDEYIVQEGVPCIVRLYGNDKDRTARTAVVVGVEGEKPVSNGKFFRTYHIQDPATYTSGRTNVSERVLDAIWKQQDPLMNSSHPESTPYLMLAISRRSRKA